MERRAFLTGIGTGLLAAPRAAVGQQGVKVYRIGLLATRPTAVFSDNFESEMLKRGWRVDRDYTLESRFTDGDYQRAPRLVAELVNLPVDILLTFNTSNARVARNATDTIPIIMITSGYPVEVGLAVSRVPQPILRFITKHRVPSITDNSLNLVRDGTVLMAYSANIRDLIVRTAYFVDRVLRGAKPGNLPIELPSRFELIINLKNARAIGLTIPPSLLARADQVIE